LQPWHVVAALTVAGGVLRFAVLDLQGFAYDEAVTLEYVRNPDLGHVVHRIVRTQSTPPLYYVLAWLWTHVFGSGETGLRSLSAVCGTALIPVAYLTGSALVSRRAGVVTAALVAFNPYLFWYSQEGRPYALFVLLATLSVLFLARSLRDPRPLDLVLWGVTAILATATHYFGAFLLVPEAVVLAVARLRGWGAVAVAATLCATAPLAAQAVRKRNYAGWVTDTSLSHRILETGRDFLTGPQAYPVGLLVTTAVLLGLALVAAATRLEGRERRGALLAAGLALVALAAPLVLAIGGIDVVLHRNLISLVPLLLIVAAAGLAAAPRHWGLAGAAALTAVSLASVLVTFYDPANRHDWRAIGLALRPERSDRIIVVAPPLDFLLLYHYAPVAYFPPSGVKADEIVVLAPSSTPTSRLPTVPAGFRPDGTRSYGTIVRRDFHSGRARLVRPAAIAPGQGYTPGQQLLVG
jgi:4-amino-4-deoxy-L-arabinose transferase-like glycosyltransferase